MPQLPSPDLGINICKPPITLIARAFNVFHAIYVYHQSNPLIISHSEIHCAKRDNMESSFTCIGQRPSDILDRNTSIPSLRLSSCMLLAEVELCSA